MIILYSNLVITLRHFCLDSWKDHIVYFLREMNSKYKQHLSVNKKQAAAIYAAIAKQAGMYGAFHEVGRAATNYYI